MNSKGRSRTSKKTATGDDDDDLDDEEEEEDDLPEHRYVLKNKSKLVDCRTGLAVLIIDAKNEEFYPILYGIPNCYVCKMTCSGLCCKCNIISNAYVPHSDRVS